MKTITLGHGEKQQLFRKLAMEATKYITVFDRVKKDETTETTRKISDKGVRLVVQKFNDLLGKKVLIVGINKYNNGDIEFDKITNDIVLPHLVKQSMDIVPSPEALRHVMKKLK